MTSTRLLSSATTRSQLAARSSSEDGRRTTPAAPTQLSIIVLHELRA